MEKINQEIIFNEIINMKHDIQTLAEFIQNDFEFLLKDGYITKNEILEAINDMDDSYYRFINKVINLRQKSRKIMEYYASL